MKRPACASLLRQVLVQPQVPDSNSFGMSFDTRGGLLSKIFLLVTSLRDNGFRTAPPQ